ncbi:MAG: M23 family metallopeptidase [Firmicutes bacterium]|nr:M23 family metallopeptidase [Sporosalibacterium faouarense]MTI48593.1 M23 family metallopeptidase [Bacillota bacterium]
MLEKSQTDLNVLIEDVEQRLDYLEAKPNLEPTKGSITSPFGYRKDPFTGGTDFHSGIDIANWYGTKVKAAGSGVVTFAGYNGSYGYVIVVKHGYGYESIYAHNRKLLVKVGDRIKKGQVISEMGSTGRSTGPHLHFEVRYHGDPVNPLTVLNNDD